MDSKHIHEDVPGGMPLKMWTRGVPVEDAARRQLAKDKDVIDETPRPTRTSTPRCRRSAIWWTWCTR